MFGGVRHQSIFSLELTYAVDEIIFVTDKMVPRQLILSQFILILVSSYSSTWSIGTHVANSSSLFGQLVLILSARTHLNQLVLMVLVN